MSSEQHMEAKNICTSLIRLDKPNTIKRHKNTLRDIIGDKERIESN